MAKKFEAPGNLQELEAADLEAAVKAAFERAEELRPKEGSVLSEEDFAEASTIRDFVRAAKEENAQRTAAAEEREALFNDIQAEMDAAVPADEAPADEAPADAAPADAAPADEAPADAAPAEDAQAGVLVNASRKAPANFNRGSVAARAAQAAPKSSAPTAEVAKSRVFAAQDIPGYKGGQEFDSFSAAAGAILSKLNTLPAGYVENTFQRGTALQIQLPENEFSTGNPKYKGKDITELINDAANEKRLAGGSLVAAGGWGAPSERSLDFCEIESLDGLVSVPEVTITRGGIEWTRGPNFGDVLASSTGFWDMTEAVAEAGTELKTSIRPEVPDFEEARLDAVGVMMENGLLLRQGWPELVDRWAKLTLLAHQYKLAQKKIAQIRTLSGSAVNIPNGFGNALDILHILEMLANGERQRLLLSPSQTLEALIPWWVKSVIRVDLAQRSGVDTVTVTDAQIESHFTARNIKVQWIKAFQDLALDATTGLALTYPDTVEVIFYPAGSFVAGVAPVITLDTIYDSTNLKKNDYVHLFVEQGVLMTNPCNRGNRVTFPFFANGRRAGTSDANDNFANAPIA